MNSRPESDPTIHGRVCLGSASQRSTLNTLNSSQQRHQARSNESGLGTASPNGTMASRNGAADSAPPPSTLAAQLVENISASTRTSRSDDNAELRRLSATIQQVESNPGLLQTPNDQLRHNHLLTYVFIRAVLGSIRINDPFADRNHLRTEVLRAINFLKLIVQETPAVLQFTDTTEHKFELRGDEPLWVWVFPKLLRLLGHTYFLELSADIESFFHYVLALLASSRTLQNTFADMAVYFREISHGEGS